MDETYRMLGREHEADLEREARKWQRAAEVRGPRSAPSTTPDDVRKRKPIRLVPARLTAFLMQGARGEG